MVKPSMAALCCLFFLSPLALAGSGSADGAAPAKVRTRCVFPDSPRERAPAWVCSKQAPGVALAALGSFRKTKAGVQFAKDQAAASARVALAQAMAKRLDRKLRGYAAQQRLAGAPALARKLAGPAFEQRTRETLEGSRILQQATSRKGTIYVLVGIDAQQASQATREIVKRSAEQEPALWRPLQGRQSADELAAAIDRLE